MRFPVFPRNLPALAGWASGSLLLFSGPVVAQFDVSRGADINAAPPTPHPDSGLPDMGPLVVFFPPTPPPFGGALPTSAITIARAKDDKLVAKDDLADFVGETFYAALGARLYSRPVDSRMRARLAAYVQQRATLLDELNNELMRWQNARRLDREQGLRAFAPRQAEGLLALEEEAERLRRDLVKGRWLQRKNDVHDFRAWRLGVGSAAIPPASYDAELQAARGAAFFQDGLSIEQRGLLREMAMEAARSGRLARGRKPSPDDDARVLFFSPETARMRTPTGAPAELQQQLGRFNGEKIALHRELLDVLTETDPMTETQRASRFFAFAIEQAVRIRTLEENAEEIRRRLDALREPAAPWVPPISPELQARIESYNRARLKLLAEHTQAAAHALRNLAAFVPPGTVSGPGNEAMTLSQRRAEAARRAQKEFEEIHAERIDELRRQYDRIRTDLTAAALDLKEPETGRVMTVDTMLQAYRVAMQRFDEIGREEAMYERYKVAMLQPGLSPAQRRLLFRAAHAQLAQELPDGMLFFPDAPKPGSY